MIRPYQLAGIYKLVMPPMPRGLGQARPEKEQRWRGDRSLIKFLPALKTFPGAYLERILSGFNIYLLQSLNDFYTNLVIVRSK